MTDAKQGYGQLQPPAVQGEFGRAAFLVSQMMARVRTMTPVLVKAVHPGAGTPPVAGTVDVQPLVSMIDGNMNAKPHGTINGLPYLRIQGGTNAVILDPAVGDIGFAVVSDRDMSGVAAAKKVAPPGSLRRGDLADGVYVGGILNAAPTQYVLFSDSGVTVADKNGNTLVSSNTGWVLTGNVKVIGTLEATALETADGNMLVKGNLEVQGTATFDGSIDVKGTSVFEQLGTFQSAANITGALGVTGAINASGVVTGTSGLATNGGVTAQGASSFALSVSVNTLSSAGAISAGGVISSPDLQIPGHLLYSVHNHPVTVPSTPITVSTGTPN